MERLRLHRNSPKNSIFVAPRCRNSAAPIRSRSSHVLPAATCRLSKAKHVSTTTILYQLQLAYGASKWRTSAWQHLNDWPTPIPLKARFPPKKNVGLIFPFHPCLWRPSVPSSARCNSSPTSSPKVSPGVPSCDKWSTNRFGLETSLADWKRLECPVKRKSHTKTQKVWKAHNFCLSNINKAVLSSFFLREKKNNFIPNEFDKISTLLWPSQNGGVPKMVVRNNHGFSY